MNVVAKRTRLSPEHSIIYFPVVERPLFWHAKDGTPHVSPDHKQLVRVGEDGKTPIPLAVVGENYKLVLNKDLFEAIEHDIIENMPEKKLKNVSVNDTMSYHGALCLREYTFQDISRKIEGPEGHASTEVAFRVIVINGYGSTSVRIILGAIDFFCMNGTIIGVSDRKMRRHTSGLDVSHLANYITDNLTLFERNADMWCKWAKKFITEEQLDAFFTACVENKYISARLADQLRVRFYTECSVRGGTLWALVSALTYYSSHNDEASGFTIRDTGKDHEAATMIKRSETIRDLIASPAFQALTE